MRGSAIPGLRRGALTALPVGVCALGELSFDVSFAGALTSGALIAGFVAFDAPAKIRFLWQLIAAPVIGVAAALGVLSSQSAVLAVVVMTLVATAAGFCVAVSPRLSIAAMIVVLALLIAQGLSLDAADAPLALGLATAGALLQALLSLCTWIVSDRETEDFDLSRDARAARATLSAQLTPESPAFRHAIRWGLALGAGVAVYRFIDLQGHGYWVPLTILFVLKPTLDDTRERLAMRAVGTLAGLLLATVLAAVLTNEPVAVAVMLAIAAAIAYALLPLEYAIFTTAITVFVVLLTDSLGTPALEAADQRALATLLGIAIAAAAFAALPGQHQNGA